MAEPIKNLYKDINFARETLTMNNTEKRIELMALDLLFRAGYYEIEP